MNHLNPTKKHHAYFLFDCKLGNPNGDPDRNNLPRTDDETGKGLVTSVCLKRKIRDYVDFLAKTGQIKEDLSTYKILIESGSVINEQIARGYSELNIDPATKKSKGRDLVQTTIEEQMQVAQWIASNFYDVRMFGAVLSTGLKAGNLCGPLQVTFAESFDPVNPCLATVTRCAATEREENKENKTMGTQAFIPYGLYACEIFYNPCKDKFELVSGQDLHVLWESLQNLWQTTDLSAARGKMTPRGLWVFSHETKYGNAPVHKLTELIQVKKKDSVAFPRDFSDYQVIDNTNQVDSLTNGKVSVVNLI